MIFKKKNNLFIVILIFSISFLNGQNFDHYFPKSGNLSFPFSGGLNNPQFSPIDINFDGFQDLFVFDRACDCVEIFINNGVKDSALYLHNPEYSKLFPSLQHWAFLKDYNGDGIQDLFAYSDIPGIDGIIVYQGKIVNQKYSFERFQFDHPFNLIHFNQPSGNKTPLYVSKIDFPAIDDVDCDGDLDIITFNSGGGLIEFYENKNKTNFIFERANRCWGGIFESGISEIVDLAKSPGECAQNIAENLPAEQRHAGSTLLTVDATGNGLKDLILGDISYNNLTLLINRGTCELAWMNQQEVFFPEISLPVNIAVFPLAASLDLNNDGKLDLVASSNDRLNLSGKNNVWFYEGNDSLFLDELNLVKKDFLVDQMLDFGIGSSPVVYDVNLDGLLDLIVGYEKPTEDTTTEFFGLKLYLNRGSTSEPDFILYDSDFLQLSQFQFTSALKPAIGDLDGDGKDEIVIGEIGGRLFYGKFTFGADPFLKVDHWNFPFMDIDVGNYSQPFIFDYNRDGLGDLFVGEQNANLNYFENKGIIGQPQFSKNPDNPLFGNIDARTPGYFFGYSSPFVYENEKGLFILTGSESGIFKLYQRKSGDQFELISENFGGLDAGARSRPYLADLNSNGFYNLISGNYRGGLLTFNTDVETNLSTSLRPNPYVHPLKVFPNPANQFITILNEFEEENQLLEIYDISGQLVWREITQLNTNRNIYIQNKLNSGTFILHIQAGNQKYSGKIIVSVPKN